MGTRALVISLLMLLFAGLPGSSWAGPIEFDEKIYFEGLLPGTKESFSNAIRDSIPRLNKDLLAHMETLGGDPHTTIKLDLSKISVGDGQFGTLRGAVGTLRFRLANGIEFSMPFEVPTHHGSDGEVYLEEMSPLLERIRAFTREKLPLLISLKPNEVHEELQWIASQLESHSSTLPEQDREVVKTIVAEARKVPSPEANRGWGRGKADPISWMKKNYPRFTAIREHADTWTKELGINLLGFEESLAARRAHVAQFFYPVNGRDAALLKGLESHLLGPDFHSAHEELKQRGARLRIQLDEPIQAIAPKAPLPGRVEIKGTFTVVDANGHETPHPISVKINTNTPASKIYAGKEWQEAFGKQFHATTLQSVITQVHSMPARSRVEGGADAAPKVRVAEQAPAPADPAARSQEDEAILESMSKLCRRGKR
jgi:hypothetical protein